MCAAKVLGSAFLAAALLFSCTAAQTIPVDQEDACVSVNDPDNVTYTCTSDSSMTVLWQVATRQLRNTAEFEADGIFVTDSVDRLNSTILFTTEGRLFVTMLVRSPEFVVTCQTVRNVIDVVEGDTRSIFVYNAPPPPVDLTLTPTSVALRYSLEWQRPGEPDCVPINYQVNVTNLNTNTLELERVGVSGDVSRDRESLPYDDTDSEICQLHEFSIISLNDAGSSAPASITETIPISPNIGPINSSLTAAPVLDDGVEIAVFFEPATSCNSTAYPVVNYIISISGLAGNVSVPHTEGESVSVTLTTSDFPGLVDDAYTVNVMACAAFACRLAQPVSVVTSDVQSANITFLNTTVSLFCEFTETGTGSGCRFQLSLPDGTSETLDLARPSAGGVVSQQCATTQNQREAYQDIVVVALDANGQQRSSSFQVSPEVIETTDEAAISPCEPPTPVVEIEEVETSTFSAGEITAVIIAVLVVFAVLITVLVVVVWWRWQNIQSVYKKWVHPIDDEDGLDLMMREDTDRPTVMMLMKNLVPGPNSTTTTLPRKKGLTREVSQQPDMAVTKAEDEVALKSRDEPASPSAASCKDPVAGIKMMDPSDPNSLKLVLKPATLAKVVQAWKSKSNHGNEMLLYWKEDEEDVDDDEPYWEDQNEDSNM